MWGEVGDAFLGCVFACLGAGDEVGELFDAPGPLGHGIFNLLDLAAFFGELGFDCFKSFARGLGGGPGGGGGIDGFEFFFRGGEALGSCGGICVGEFFLLGELRGLFEQGDLFLNSGSRLSGEGIGAASVGIWASCWRASVNAGAIVGD